MTARLIGGELADLEFEIAPGCEVLDFDEVGPIEVGIEGPDAARSRRYPIETRPEWRYVFVGTEQIGEGLRALFEWQPRV
jgi:hypothetical protein